MNLAEAKYRRLAIFLPLFFSTGCIACLAEEVAPPSEEEIVRLVLDPFYKKHLSVKGFPIVSSEKVSDYALREAAFLIEKMIGHRQDILDALIAERVRLSIMARTNLRPLFQSIAI